MNRDPKIYPSGRANPGIPSLGTLGMNRILEYDSDGSHILDGLIFLRMMSLVALNH